MMEIRTLNDCTLAEITAAFNAAFTGYFIPLQFTETGMQTKMKGEGILPECSIGAFDVNKLVAFILHAVDVVDNTRTVYNAGTGVVPGYRGRGITAALYQYAIPLLQQRGINQHVLEVIVENQRARKIYEAVGFQTVRRLAAFRRTTVVDSPSTLVVQPISRVPDDPAFFSMKPSWQNTTASIHRDPESHRLIGAFTNEKLVGFGAFVPATGRVKQLAVLPCCRRQKVGTALLQLMQQQSQTRHLLLTNVDEDNNEARLFLQALQFERILGLYEMKMNCQA